MFFSIFTLGQNLRRDLCGINRAGERKPYIMYPMKIQNREFFGLNMKFSMCRDYTKFFSKIAPCAKGEKNYQKLQVIRTILLKISNLEANLEIFKRIVRITCIFAYFFHPLRTERFWKFFCIVSTHTKLHVQGKKSPFWIFHRGHDVSISLPGSVKSER